MIGPPKPETNESELKFGNLKYIGSLIFKVFIRRTLIKGKCFQQHHVSAREDFPSYFDRK